MRFFLRTFLPLLIAIICSISIKSKNPFEIILEILHLYSNRKVYYIVKAITTFIFGNNISHGKMDTTIRISNVFEETEMPKRDLLQ